MVPFPLTIDDLYLYISILNKFPVFPTTCCFHDTLPQLVAIEMSVIRNVAGGEVRNENKM